MKKQIMAMSAARNKRTYELVVWHGIHAFPDKAPYPNENLPFFIPVGPDGKMEYVFAVTNIVTCDPKELHTLKGTLSDNEYERLKEYDAERNSFFGYSEDVDFKFYFLHPVAAIRQPFTQKIRNAKAFSYDEIPVVGMKKKLDQIESGRAWIFSYDSETYFIHAAMHMLQSIDWDVSHSITKGKVRENDIVYLYGAKPEQSIAYRCRVIKANKEKTTVDDTIFGGNPAGTICNCVELELECEYKVPGIKYQGLLDHGLKAGNLSKRRIIEPQLVKFFQEYDADSSNILDWDTISGKSIDSPQQSDVPQKPIEKEIKIEEIEDTSVLLGSEKEVVVKARINQGVFRERLLTKYNGCCLCGITDTRLLIASHIKPWRDSDRAEKTDPENGLLLCPNHDQLFDRGLISFEEDGRIIISESVSEEERVLLNVNRDMQIRLTKKMIPYIQYHRNRILS